ncbi:MAG: asparagine synthetase B family protein [Thermodesulfobacteriota bacterium]
MGLIAGSYLFKKKRNDLKFRLMEMINSQAHRDNSPPTLKLSEHFAFGMANRHDSIFCSLTHDNHFSTDFRNQPSRGIIAFIDGVLLNVPEHIKYFEEIGIPLSRPTCSAIIAAAYEKWGLDFMKHLEGEFACAVLDEKSQKVILARDPYGHKPLHFYFKEDMLLFSSEIKGIIAGGISPEVDMIGLSDFLSLNNIPCPATLFKDISQVSPGHLAIFSEQGCIMQPYWSHKIITDKVVGFDEAVLLVSDRIRNAVKKRMVTKDTYCFLSGGIDSSALVSFAAELSATPVHAVSVGFKEEEKNELEDAAVMANHVGAIHHQVIATPDSFLDMLDTIVFHQDLPFTDTSSYPTYYAGKLARNFTDLILTGDGPDQTMGGSGHHVFAVRNNLFSNRKKTHQLLCKTAAKLAGFLSQDPSPTLLSKIERKLYRDSLLPYHAAYDLRSFFPDIVKKFICTDALWEIHEKTNPYRHPASWFRESKDLDGVNKYLFADINFYIPCDLMIKVDRMCMAHGLETLSPFQDVDLARIVNKLPGSHKINISQSGEIITKYILKKICQDRFPRHTLEKKKQGFGIPLAKWLRQDHGRFLREILLDPRTINRGYFKKDSLEKFIEVFLDDKGDYYFPAPEGMVGLLSLELWHRRFI